MNNIKQLEQDEILKMRIRNRKAIRRAKRQDLNELIVLFVIAIATVTAFVYTLLPASAEAENIKPLKIRLIAATSEFGLDCEETKSYFADVESLYKSVLGVRFNVVFRCIEARFIANELAAYRNVLYSYDSNYINRVLPTKIITGPIIDSGTIFSGGVAFVGLERGLALSYVTQKNSSGDDRSYWAFAVIAHELGHMLGAYHDESQGSIMSTEILYRLLQNPNQTLFFTDKSKRQIRREVRAYHRGVNSVRNPSNCGGIHG